jgi:hypothetical protein
MTPVMGSVRRRPPRLQERLRHPSPATAMTTLVLRQRLCRLRAKPFLTICLMQRPKWKQPVLLKPKPKLKSMLNLKRIPLLRIYAVVTTNPAPVL